MRWSLPGFVKREMKAVWSRFVAWLREWTKPDAHGLVSGAVADACMVEKLNLREKMGQAARR